MPPPGDTAAKRERKRQPSVRITEETEAKLTKLAQITAQKVQDAGGLALKPSHAQLVEAMVDTALNPATPKAA